MTAAGSETNWKVLGALRSPAHPHTSCGTCIWVSSSGCISGMLSPLPRWLPHDFITLESEIESGISDVDFKGLPVLYIFFKIKSHFFVVCPLEGMGVQSLKELTFYKFIKWFSISAVSCSSAGLAIKILDPLPDPSGSLTSSASLKGSVIKALL